MSESRPLAEQLRPQTLEDVLGQDHILGDKGFIHQQVASGKPASIVLWGPPGSGKTTVARLYAQAFDAQFIQISAVFSGVADLKKVVQQAKDFQNFEQRTVLFVDEIHRFNKAQQDAFLPYVEDGTIILVGATTENPSFELNNALLSRVRVLTIKALAEESLLELLNRAEGLVGKLPINQEGREYLAHLSAGDGRYLLNLVENLQAVKEGEELDVEALGSFLQRRAAQYDRAGDAHYSLISALHKSVRSSDPDASLYWLARMLNGGEEPLYIARRLIRIASEDIGLADPQALQITLVARQTYEVLGSPEGELALAQAAVYLALAPKSNAAAYAGFKQAMTLARKTASLNPPAHILNAPTQLMKDEGYGKGYVYDHDAENGFSGQKCFPDDLEQEPFYQPVERGFEREMVKRMNYFNKLRKEA